jgi:8-oxo-dGTP diphosphatase
VLENGLRVAIFTAEKVGLAAPIPARLQTWPHGRHSRAVSAPRLRKLVVAGLVVDDLGRVLITQRRADQPLPLQWELPGGKIEPGEGPEAALVRELDEELGVTVVVGRIWDVLFHAYPDFDLLMLVYPCRLAPDEVPTCVEVADLAWCLPPSLAGYDILPADAPLIARLIAEGPPPR